MTVHRVTSRPQPDNPDWWRDAVCYQVYLPAFSDGNGDGIGDLDGLRARLGYLELLGVDALWLTPIYPAPDDAGFRVVNPTAPDPSCGDLDAFDALLAAAHRRGIRVLLDLVLNHTGAHHRWFQQALHSPPGSQARARYFFANGRDPYHPPNNWTSIDGHSAWTQTADGQWYLHLRAADQPDLNWADASVRADAEHIARFWLERGIDGFFVDTADGLVKPPGLPDIRPDDDPRFDNDGVHDAHRLLRKIVDGYPGAVLIGDLGGAAVSHAYHEGPAPHRCSRYLRYDELHLASNRLLAHCAFDADEVAQAIDDSFAALGDEDTSPTWLVAGPDLPRQTSRFGGGKVGAARARAMALVQLALPGTAFIFAGEELGLASDGVDRGSRGPVPWEGDAPPFGFFVRPSDAAPGASPWLSIPPDLITLTVAAQLERADSTLSLYRAALELRKHHPALRSGIDGGAGVEYERSESANPSGVRWYGSPPGCIAFRPVGGRLTCALNTSSAPVPLPPGEVLLASAPLALTGGHLLPPDTAVWLA